MEKIPFVVFKRPSINTSKSKWPNIFLLQSPSPTCMERCTGEKYFKKSPSWRIMSSQTEPAKVCILLTINKNEKSVGEGRYISKVLNTHTAKPIVNSKGLKKHVRSAHVIRNQDRKPSTLTSEKGIQVNQNHAVYRDIQAGAVKSQKMSIYVAQDKRAG